ncbi:DUF7311 family protein [Haloarcula salina]|uniref:DUF7311 family protein n=1 Tax=Haloarcula salina TaxID=1429914 RepID=UPI003C6FCE72
MILRVVLSVAVLTGLIATTAPALSAARADAATGTMERQLDELATRLNALAVADDPTPSGDARRVAVVRVPGRSYTSAGVDWLRFHGRAGDGVATWRVENRTVSRRVAPVPIRPSRGARRFREPGSHRLVFALTRTDGRRVLTVARLGTQSEGGQSRA